MRRGSALAAAVALVSGCGSATLQAEAELAAATFLVEVSASDVAVVDRDRQAGTGEENRLDVVRPGGTMEIITIHSGTPVPDPFEFVRDPLGRGSLEPVLADSERVIVVIFPLIEPTPGGRVLSGSLIGFGPGGNLVHTDWDDESFEAVNALLAWGAEQGRGPLATLELAVRGLGGSSDPAATTAADFLH
ncbi:MAG: hypothetical protein ACLGHX_04710 [Acidimicrobiia bacterium]